MYVSIRKSGYLSPMNGFLKVGNNFVLKTPDTWILQNHFVSWVAEVANTKQHSFQSENVQTLF